jgi:predicted transcriptional regulator
MAKDELIKARVSEELKKAVEEIAAYRGESEALIIREAISEYLEKRKAKPEVNVNYRKSAVKRKVA